MFCQGYIEKNEYKVYVNFRTSGLKHCFGRLRQELGPKSFRQALDNMVSPPLKQNSTRPGIVEADQEFKEVILDYMEYQASLTYIESQ